MVTVRGYASPAQAEHFSERNVFHEYGVCVFTREGSTDDFIKGRMATGYAILMDIQGHKLTLKPIPKFEQMKRVSARSSWIIHQRTIPSFSSPITSSSSVNTGKSSGFPIWKGGKKPL